MKILQLKADFQTHPPRNSIFSSSRSKGVAIGDLIWLVYIGTVTGTKTDHDMKSLN